LGLLIFSNSRIDLEKKIQNQLSSISQITENNILIFLEGQKHKIELISTQNDLSNEELQTMLRLDDSFYDFFIINSSGIVIRSSDSKRIGLDRSNRSYFVNARNQTYISEVYFAQVPQEYSISVSTPFKDGVLVGAMKLDVLSKLVLDRTGLGETGESLLAFKDEGGNVHYFGERRFSDKKFEVLTFEQAKGRPIVYAIEGNENIFSNLRDYRNVLVLAVTNGISLIRVGLVTKIDSTEILKSINSLQVVTIFLVILITLLVSFVIFIISRQISQSILGLSKDIDAITHGNLEIQLRKSSIFEIRSLIDSLNRILASMKLAILRTGVGKSELGLGEAINGKAKAEKKLDFKSKGRKS
jgi:methyl-accepting chemotaxis protein